MAGSTGKGGEVVAGEIAGCGFAAVAGLHPLSLYLVRSLPPLPTVTPPFAHLSLTSLSESLPSSSEAAHSESSLSASPAVAPAAPTSL